MANPSKQLPNHAKKLQPLGFPHGREKNQASAFGFFGQNNQMKKENLEGYETKEPRNHFSAKPTKELSNQGKKLEPLGFPHERNQQANQATTFRFFGQNNRRVMDSLILVQYLENNSTKALSSIVVE